jgi:hypothetical protein
MACIYTDGNGYICDLADGSQQNQVINGNLTVNGILTVTDIESPTYLDGGLAVGDYGLSRAGLFTGSSLTVGTGQVGCGSVSCTGNMSGLSVSILSPGSGSTDPNIYGAGNLTIQSGLYGGYGSSAANLSLQASNTYVNASVARFMSEILQTRIISL